MCGGSAESAGWFEPGSLHRATLKGLPAGSRVFYEVYDKDNEAEVQNDAKNARAVSRFGSFSTPALPREGNHEEARIVLMADAGTGDSSPSTQSPGWIFAATRNTSAAVAADLEAPLPESSRKTKGINSGFNGRLLVHAGDISYANGHGSIWDAFFEQWRPALERARYAAVVGNHGEKV